MCVHVWVFLQPEIFQRFEKETTIPFIQRVMVGVIILYDHVHLVGAFSKRNPSIDVRAGGEEARRTQPCVTVVACTHRSGRP